MKKIGFILLVVFFLVVIFLTQLKLINQTSQEYDEGVYLTTFLLINSSHAAYKETFLSQPPGFLLSAYPGFVLLGKNLQAARMTIGIWSLIGLLAIIWICFELKNKWAGIFALGILYLSPYYFNQTLVFHADILGGTFSLITLAAIFRYINTKRLKWFLLATIFLNLAFWSKFDFFLVPSLLIIAFYLFKNKKPNYIKLSSIFIAVSLLFFAILVIPLGIMDVLDDTLGLRLSAVNSYPTRAFIFFIYLKQSFPVLLLTVAGIWVTFLRKDNFRFPLLPLLVWVITVFFTLVFYKPLFIHHMIIFIVPLSLYFSLSFTSWLKKHTVYYHLIISVFLLFSLSTYLLFLPKNSTSLLYPDQQEAVKIIDQYTNQNDLVVSDDGMLTATANRLPPPELSDISYVRIYGQNLSSEKFEFIINKYKPKLIIPWNGRMILINDFKEIIKDYKQLTIINHKIIYIRRD